MNCRPLDGQNDTDGLHITNILSFPHFYVVWQWVQVICLHYIIIYPKVVSGIYCYLPILAYNIK